jgi:hypothetical protein
MGRTERMFNGNRHRHRHGGKRIPNFVRPEERHERRRRPAQWFESIQDLFGGHRAR